MALTLPINPSYGWAGKTEAKILEAEFGDGYSQRMPDGLNWLRDSMPLRWENLHEAEKDTLIDFFADHGGYIYWLWAPPGEDQKKWVATSWERTPKGADCYTVVANVKQVFDL